MPKQLLILKNTRMKRLFLCLPLFKKAAFYRQSAEKIAAYLYRRGLNFPTEGGATDAGMIAIGVCIVLLLVIGFCNRKKVS